MNPDSLTILNGCKVEKSMAEIAKEYDKLENKSAVTAPTFQFMRVGFFCLDCKDSTPEHIVFNRTVSLKDSFKK